MKRHVRQYYTGLYDGDFRPGPPVTRGKVLAGQLGYPLELLETIPDDLWEDFLPCGNVLPCLHPRPGQKILNVGCGAGIDSLALLLTSGFPLKVVNLDIVFPILARASRRVRGILPGCSPDWICAEGEILPFAEGIFDSVILNGVFNLFTDKRRFIEELGRVLRKGAVLAGADLCRKTALPDYFSSEPDAWAWCMSGALSARELETAFQSGGFRKTGAVAEQMDAYFDRVVFSFERAER